MEIFLGDWVEGRSEYHAQRGTEADPRSRHFLVHSLHPLESLFSVEGDRKMRVNRVEPGDKDPKAFAAPTGRIM